MFGANVGSSDKGQYGLATHCGHVPKPSMLHVMRLPGAKLRILMERWAALLQLAAFEANNGRTGSARMRGIIRAHRIGVRYFFLAVGPVFILIIPDSMGLHGGPVWWALASVTGAWALFVLLMMTSATAVSFYRAARVRLATDRGDQSRYPRKLVDR